MKLTKMPAVPAPLVAAALSVALTCAPAIAGVPGATGTYGGGLESKCSTGPEEIPESKCSTGHETIPENEGSTDRKAQNLDSKGIYPSRLLPIIPEGGELPEQPDDPEEQRVEEDGPDHILGGR